MDNAHSSPPSTRVKRLHPLSSCVIAAALAAGMFMLVDIVALAQNSKSLPQVTVQADRSVKHVTVGRTYSGIPIEELQLTRHVAYNDLNLRSPAGVEELKHRIKDSAEEACKQLSTLYPLEMWMTDNESCVKSAIDGAMAQLPSAVATAEKSKKATSE